MLTIGSALSKGWRSGPEAFRAGHYKDLTETGNRARKVSGTQGSQPTVTTEISELGDEGDMPDVKVCLHSTILRFSQNVIILYKFILGVLIPCNARLITVQALSHSKQPQYALSRTI